MEIIVTLCFLLPFIFINHLDAYVINNDYWSKRANFLREEEEMAIGYNLPFNTGESTANTILMNLKNQEILRGFEDSEKYLPAKNFLMARDKIAESEVFKIIQQMPKGAVLHAHDTSIVSDDFIYHNITFLDNLWVCDVNGTLSGRFFNLPDNTCDWHLLSELRANESIAVDINKKIRAQLTMVTAHPEHEYATVDAAWNKFMDIFEFITPILTYRPVYEAHFYQGLKELYEDNVIYLELRSTLPPLYELDGTVYGPVDVVDIYHNVSKRFMADYPDFVGVKIIYAPLRFMTQEEITNYVNVSKELSKKFPNFLAGIDLVGQEDKGGSLISYINELQEVSKHVKPFFHAGETNWYGTTSDENLIDAILLDSKRIGHGYGVLKHPKVLDYMKKNNIAVEICPISNQVLGLIKDLRNHPASVLFANNFPIVISNDDPGLWGARALSYDFYEAFVGMMSMKADIRALKLLAMNSITFSSMNETEKTRAMHVWQEKWTNFINSINQTQNEYLVKYE